MDDMLQEHLTRVIVHKENLGPGQAVDATTRRTKSLSTGSSPLHSVYAPPQPE